MKRLTCYLVCAAWLLAPTSYAAGEEPKKTDAWSLQDCIKAALENQADVLMAQNNVTIARGRASAAKSAYFPQVSLQNNAFRWGSESVLTKVTTGTALSVSQNVFDGGLREANARGTRYGVAQNQAGLTRTIQTTMFSVTRAYCEVLRARHLAEVAETNVKYNEELRKQVEFMASKEVGTAAKVDVLPVEAQLANARVNLLSAQNSVRTAALALQTEMGVAPKAGFDVQELEPPASPEVGPLESLVSLALKSRPDILQNQANLGAARASVRSARLALYPRPVIGGEYQRQVSGGFTTSGTQVVGGIVFDIFNGNANRAAFREARASQANADLQEKQLYKDIHAQVEEAYLNSTSAKERLAASAMGVEAAQKNYDAQKERYAQGMGTTLDMLNAEVQVVTAQSNDVQARYDYYTAIAQMEYALGKQGGTR